MCAWKRGVNNNQAGEIRRGQIREFLQPSSKETSVSHKLKIIDTDNTSSFAVANFYSFPDSFQEFISIDKSLNLLYLHAHEHPTSVITCIADSSLPLGCILLNEAHRINSKICVGENEEFTVYQGEQFTYDAREVSIGDTKIRSTSSCPNLDCIVFDIILKHPRKDSSNKYILNSQLLKPQLLKYFLFNILTVEEVFSFHFFDVEYIISVIEVRLTSLDNDDDIDNTSTAEEEDKDEDSLNAQEYTIDTPYRGMVTQDTKIYITVNTNASGGIGIEIINNTSVPPPIPLKNVVYIETNDNECFPVKRCLLRPCLALTVLVQSGRGKYANNNTMTSLSSVAAATSVAATAATLPVIASDDEKADSISVVLDMKGYTEANPFHINIDACTFDRVLLYLEHEFRHETFHFDPLIVNELRDAAIILKIIGLIDICDKVLGSFQDRVRRTPIRYSEVVSRNNISTQLSLLNSDKKRTETLLLLSGMVLDISRWLDEHPGGSTIIPEQSLNVDSSVFFEIYHASKQSYLYLKEFYIGELADEDLSLVPLPATGTGAATAVGSDRVMSVLSTSSSSSSSSSSTTSAATSSGGSTSSSSSGSLSSVSGPSAAFREQLAKFTAWRLRPQDMNLDYKNAVHKSF